MHMIVLIEHNIYVRHCSRHWGPKDKLEVVFAAKKLIIYYLGETPLNELSL